jgi:hypothetical protein
MRHPTDTDLCHSERQVTKCPSTGRDAAKYKSLMLDRERIRELYTRRKPAYAIDDVLRLLAIDRTQLTAAVVGGSVRIRGGAATIRWDDVAHLALDRWSLRAINDALGERRNGCVPPLNHFGTVRIRIPIYQIRVLHELARRESSAVGVQRNASDVMERQLLDLVAALEREELDALVPGAADALQYPYYVPVVALPDRRCYYCGRGLDEARLDICEGCQAIHES